MIITVIIITDFRGPKSNKATAVCLTYGRLTGEHRGGQSTGRSPVQPGGPFDEVRRFLQQAASNSDVVNP